MRLSWLFLLAATLWCFSPTTSAAQGCPPGWQSMPPDTLTVTFTNPFCMTRVVVTYCIPGPWLGPPTQYYITAVKILDPCLDSVGNEIPMSGSWMTDLAKALLDKNPGGIPCSGCSADWRVSWGTCERPIYDSDGRPVWVACYEDYRCTEVYEVCCIGGTKTIRLIAKSGSRPCDSGCVQVCN